MDQGSVNINVLRASRVSFNDRNFAVTYFSDDCHVLHCYDYSGNLRIGDNAYTLHPGDVSFTPQSTPSSYHVHAPGTHFYIHFRMDLDGICELSAPMHLHSGVDQRHLRERFQLVRHYIGIQDDPLARDAANLVVNELLLRLVLGQRHAMPGAADPVALAAAYLEQNLDMDMTIPEVADEVGMSPNYLAVRFRESYGVTMKRYLLEKRIETGRYLLASTDLTVVAIGKRVGIPDPQYFNKLFRNVVGASPSAYRDGVSHSN